MQPQRVGTLVLGAGIAGCALAYHLVQRGETDVTVYDPRTPAAGATGRAAGVLTQQLWDPWDIRVTRESQREYAELCRRADPTAYRTNGFVRWTARAGVADGLEEARERLRAWGVGAEVVGASELARWFPMGRFDDIAAALYAPHDSCVTPSAIATIYADLARREGVQLDLGTPFGSVRAERGHWLVHTAARAYTARRLVVAAGAWSKAILEAAGHPLPLAPYRTQAAVLLPASAPPEEFPSFHDLDTDVYGRPEGPGRILAGDGTELTEADPERFVTGGDAGFLAHLAESFASRLPGWAESAVSASWAGLCTATHDRHPIVGPVPGATALIALTGFNGFGVMRAGGVAAALAEWMTAGDPDAAQEALGPAWAGRCAGAPRQFPIRPGFTLQGGADPRY